MSDITITRAEAEQLYELYKNVAAADNHYKRCQSDHFRLHVQGAYTNGKIKGAFESLRARLDAPENVEAQTQASRARERPRRGVLADGYEE